MRTLKAWLYVTLDGVVEAPEKWVMPDEEMFAEQTADYAASDALLLGRRTYEVFAASWPQRGSDVPNADWMNNTQKYVASTSLESPEWHNTTVLRGDVGEAVSRLKQEHGENITLNGSGGLLRWPAASSSIATRSIASSATIDAVDNTADDRHYQSCAVCCHLRASSTL
jgi:dihydrofolate reductase